MIHTFAKYQGQRSVRSKDRVETNGRTDGHEYTTDWITFPANEVGNNNKSPLPLTDPRDAVSRPYTVSTVTAINCDQWRSPVYYNIEFTCSWAAAESRPLSTCVVSRRLASSACRRRSSVCWRRMTSVSRSFSHCSSRRRTVVSSSCISTGNLDVWFLRYPSGQTIQTYRQVITHLGNKPIIGRNILTRESESL